MTWTAADVCRCPRTAVGVPTCQGGHTSDPIERWDEAEDIVELARHRYQFPFLDEFIAENVDIHYEAMGGVSFWMHVRCRDTGREWHLNFGAINSRAKAYAIVEEDK